MQYGLGIEHELIIYTGREKMLGSMIQSLYRRTKSERRTTAEILGNLDPDDEYWVVNRLNSDTFTLYIETMNKFVAPILKDELPKTDDIKQVALGNRILELVRKDDAFDNLVVNYMKKMEKSVYIDWNDIGRYVEFITQNPLQRSIGSVIYELSLYERIFLGILHRTGYPNAYYPLSGTTPFIKFQQQRKTKILTIDAKSGGIERGGIETRDVISSDYNGSLHINITLPYEKGTSYNVFLVQHFYAMLALQWFEPLFVAMWGAPDPFSVEDDNNLVEGSYRMMVNRFSGIATTAFNMSWPDIVNSMASRVDNLEARSPPAEYRNRRPGIENDLSLLEGYPYPVPETNIEGPGIGSDFRRGDLDIKQNMAENKFFGFELRTFDHVPTSMLTDILRILVLICDHSYILFKNRTYIPNPTHNDSWNTLVDKIFHEGYNAVLDEAEISSILDGLLLDQIDLNISNIKSRFAGDVFSRIVNALYEKYGKLVNGEPKGQYSKFLAKDLDGENYTEKPKMEHINERTFNRFIKYFYVDPLTGQARGFLKYFIDTFITPYTGETLLVQDIFNVVAAEDSKYLEEVYDVITYLQDTGAIRVKRGNGRLPIEIFII